MDGLGTYAGEAVPSALSADALPGNEAVRRATNGGPDGVLLHELLEGGVHCRRTGLDLGDCAAIQQPDTPSEAAECCTVGGQAPEAFGPRQRTGQGRSRSPCDESLTGRESKGDAHNTACCCERTHAGNQGLVLTARLRLLTAQALPFHRLSDCEASGYRDRKPCQPSAGTKTIVEQCGDRLRRGQSRTTDAGKRCTPGGLASESANGSFTGPTCNGPLDGDTGGNDGQVREQNGSALSVSCRCVGSERQYRRQARRQYFDAVMSQEGEEVGHSGREAGNHPLIDPAPTRQGAGESPRYDRGSHQQPGLLAASRSDGTIEPDHDQTSNSSETTLR